MSFVIEDLNREDINLHQSPITLLFNLGVVFPPVNATLSTWVTFKQRLWTGELIYWSISFVLWDALRIQAQAPYPPWSTCGWDRWWWMTGPLSSTTSMASSPPDWCGVQSDIERHHCLQSSKSTRNFVILSIWRKVKLYFGILVQYDEEVMLTQSEQTLQWH